MTRDTPMSVGHDDFVSCIRPTPFRCAYSSIPARNADAWLSPSSATDASAPAAGDTTQSADRFIWTEPYPDRHGLLRSEMAWRSAEPTLSRTRDGTPSVR